MSNLTKKGRKIYSRLIQKKLEQLGLEDKIVMVASGKKVRVLQRDDKGMVVVENGKPKFTEGDVPRASNVFRRTLKDLLKQNADVIESFLNMNVNQPEPQSEVKI